MNERTRLSRGTAVGLAVAGVVAGGVLAGTGIALAADNTVTATGSSSSSTAPPAPPTGTLPGGTASGAAGGTAPGGSLPDVHGSSPVRSDEQAVSGTQADAITAAAEKAVPGGSVYRVETDAGDGAYEAHLTKADGSEVTVKLDENLAVTAVEDGMGLGDPAPAGVPAGAPAGAPSGVMPGAGSGTSPSGTVSG